ncbi:hypothetical protein J6590_082868 [Homalodisca vitripennis]|nr:hypothetical protein J6590_082868 [Homalodisca vitripennis]
MSVDIHEIINQLCVCVTLREYRYRQSASDNRSGNNTSSIVLLTEYNLFHRC